jgi:outer membrane protein OmpU
MKKVILGTTALVLSAGVAFAGGHTDGVKVGGKAGIWLKDAGGDSDIQVNYDLNIDFSASGQTDSGLTFGLDFLIIDDTSNLEAPGSTGFQLDNSEVYVSGAFGKITVGDPDDALQKVAGIGDIGYDGLGVDDYAEFGRGIGNSNGVLYENSFGPATFYLSHARDLGDDDVAVGISFDAGGFKIGVGYEDTDGGSTAPGAIDGVTAVDVSGSFGQVGFDVVYIDHDVSTNYGVIVTFDANDALSIDVGYAYTDGDVATLNSFDSDIVDDTAIGIGFSYDLGGASLAGGVADNGVDTIWDLGVSMSF